MGQTPCESNKWWETFAHTVVVVVDDVVVVIILLIVLYLSDWVVVFSFLGDGGGSFRWRNLLPTALTVSTTFHLYRYYSMFIALLIRVIALLLPPLPPSPGAYYTVSDDRVPQVVPDHSNSSP